MSLASNPLLQLTSVSKTPVSSVAPASKTLDASADKASSFADLYAKHNQEHQAKVDNGAARATSRATAAQHDAPAAKASVKDKAVADKPAVADSGKSLPAKPDATAKGRDKAGSADAADNTRSADDSVAANDTAVDDALPLVVHNADTSDAGDDEDDDSAVAVPDATALPSTDIQPQVADVAPPAAADPSTLAPPVLDPSVVASMMPTSATAAPAAVVKPASADSDPAPDALADLPAVRLALEQSAKAQGTTSAHARPENQAEPANDADASFVNGLAAQLGQAPTGEAEAGKLTADKDFSSIIDDGLKDVKGASADTRMDNFVNRLQSLTDSPTAKTANAAPLATPLAMNQGGWSEGLVNRVMYLSSQSLKSADIQLSPAELGTLNIRVDMTPDQQTQVTFVSAHIGVRDALESQQARLKEMFAQQGLGQMDVNVSDQSRNQQGQDQQAQQASRNASSSRGGRDSGGVEGVDSSAGVAEAVAQSVVIGSSAVDYYA